VSNQNNENSMSEIINELDKDTARIVISKEIRGKYKKVSTVIRGIEMRDADMLTSELKSRIGTGGTYKEAQILLQGDHRQAVKQLLIKTGFSEESIEVL
jgi:translation initiation factor 1